MLPLTRVADTTPATDALAGRVVLVTGAAGGLGRATALACAQAGATVVLLGRKVRPLEAVYDEIETLGAPQPAIYPLDLAGASPSDYEQLAASIERECGGLDAIVHAAAHFDGLHPIEHAKPDEWQRALLVNATAPMLLTQACIPLLRASADAAVVFVFDDPARIGKAYWSGYGASKGALQQLASILHEETDTSVIRIHAVLPPPLRTQLRRLAYFGENTLQHPTPETVAPSLAWLVGAAGEAARGRTLDLRAQAAS